MSLQQGLLLLGAGIFVLILLDALRRKIKAKKQQKEINPLDPEEAERQAQVARELPNINKNLDPLFDSIDNLEVFDDDPIPLLSTQQEIQLSQVTAPPITPAAGLEETQVLAEPVSPSLENNQQANLDTLAPPEQQAEVEPQEPVSEEPQQEEQPLTVATATDVAADSIEEAEPSLENLAWEKMRQKFSLDPAFAEASRLSMQEQQRELALLKDLKTQEALRYGAVKKQTFDQDNDLVALEPPKKLVKAAKQANQPAEDPMPSPTQAPAVKASPVIEPPVTEILEAVPEVSQAELQEALLSSLENNTWGNAQQFLSLKIQAAPNKSFYFEHLTEFARITGMELSKNGFYHYVEEVAGQSYLGYSLININQPGSLAFNPAEPDASTQGLILVTTLPNTPEPQKIFERMLAVAKVIARNWEAELQDEHHSNLTQQTIEHYRQKIKDFEFQERLNAIKARRQRQ